MRPTEIIFEVTEAAEGGYDARALGHSIFTQGENWNDLKAMARDAVLCHCEQDNVPRVIRLHLVREEAIAVAVGGDGSRPVETPRERRRRIMDEVSEDIRTTRSDHSADHKVRLRHSDGPAGGILTVVCLV